MIEERVKGLACITGGDEGPLAAALARGGMDEGRLILESLVRTVGQEVSMSSCNGTAFVSRRRAIRL